MLITVKSKEEKITPFSITMEGTNTVLDLRRAIDSKLNEKPLWERFVIHANGGGSARIYFEGTKTNALPYKDNDKTLLEVGYGEDGCTLSIEGLTLYRSPWGDE